MKKLFRKPLQFHTVFENDGDSKNAPAGAADGSGNGGSGSGTGSGGSGDSGTYSKADLERAVQAERTRLEQLNRKTVLDLQRLQQSAATTTEEKDALSKRITELEQEYMSKEELAKRAKEKSDKELSEKLEKAEQTAQHWQTMFQRQLKSTAVVAAAAEAGAKKPEMFLSLLGEDIVTTEVTDDEGKSTGRYEVKVKYRKPEADGKVKELVLAPVDAFKILREDSEYSFLFNGDKASGLGSSNGKAPGPLDLKNMTPEQYRKQRGTLGLT